MRHNPEPSSFPQGSEAAALDSINRRAGFLYNIIWQTAWIKQAGRGLSSGKERNVRKVPSQSEDPSVWDFCSWAVFSGSHRTGLESCRSPRGAFWLSSFHTSQVLFTEQPQGSSSTGCFLMCFTKARQFLRQPAAATRTEREMLAGLKGTTLTPRSKSFFLAYRWPLAGCYHI